MAKEKTDKPRKKSYNPVVISILFLLLMGVIAVMAIIANKLNTGEIDIEQEIINIVSTPTPEPTETPRPSVIPDTDPGIYYEDTSEMEALPSRGRYKNNKVFTLQLGYGIQLRIGINNAGETNAIYLNPELTHEYGENQSAPYAFLMKADGGEIEYVGTPGSTDSYPGSQFFYMAGRTYDKLVPSSFVSTDQYGVKWSNTTYNDTNQTGTSILLHAIRLKSLDNDDGFLMGAAKITIVYDELDDAYRIESVGLADVSHTGELLASTREAIIMDAIRFSNDSANNLSVEITEQEYRNKESFIVVEKMNHVWFRKLYNKEGDVVSAGTFAKCDVYAVNIPVMGYGYITVYFAPEAQTYGWNRQTVNEGDELNLVIIGFDAIKPFDVETFEACMFEEDIPKLSY